MQELGGSEVEADGCALAVVTGESDGKHLFRALLRPVETVLVKRLPNFYTPAPRGVPQVEVSFDLDANGILNVSARDLGTKKETKVRIEQSSGLSKTRVPEEEIERMQRDAEVHAEEDKQRRELVEAKNNAESMCFQLEKLLKEHDAVLNQTDKDAIHSAIGQTREAIASEDYSCLLTPVSLLLSPYSCLLTPVSLLLSPDFGEYGGEGM